MQLETAYKTFYKARIESFKINSSGNQATGLCPFHEDNKRSFSVNLETGQWKCFAGCGEGNSFTFADRLDIPRSETPDWNEIIPDLPPKKKSSDFTGEISFHHGNLSQEKREYWYKRFISNKTLDNFKIGWYNGYYIFPHTDTKGRYMGYKAISEDKKQFWKPAGLGNPLFNITDIQKAVELDKTLIIAEGEKDTLVLKQEGYLAVGVSGVNGFKEDYRDLFKDVRDVVVCFDNDEPGRKGAVRAASILGYKARVVFWDDSYPEKFDINDLYVSLSNGNFRETFDGLIKNAGPLAEAPLIPAGDKVSDLVEYWNKTRGGKLLGLDTGFDKLNDRLCGLRGLTILGAAPKMGKSAFALKLACNVAEKGVPVIYYDFENGEYRLYTRIICRLAKVSEKELKLTGIPDKKSRGYEEAMDEFRKLGKNLFVVTDRKISKSNIYIQIDYAREITGQDKVLLVFDSLQKLPMKNLRDRRSEIDLWLRDLEEIRDKKYADIILISEIKRSGGTGYRPDVDTFKESGDIEYTADTALGMYKPEPDDNSLVRLEVLAGRDVESGIVADYVVLYPYWDFIELNEKSRDKKTKRKLEEEVKNEFF